MTARIFVALTFLLLPAAKAADTLSVRAGEHGDYSRLVIADAPEDWRIATSDRKIEITFPEQSYDFELSDILEKRKAHRVLNARMIDAQSSRSLVLSLTCDCPVRTSKGDGNSIVIDIFNDAPVALVENETPQPEQTVSNEARKNTAATPESIKAARDRMIALLAEARHQGVIQLRADEKEKPSPATPVTQAAIRPDPAPEPITLGVPNTAPLPLAAREQAATPAPVETPVAETVEDAACVDPALFDEPKNDEVELTYAAITNLRQRFDGSIDEDERRAIAATLALAYIHIGFFEEASAIALAQAEGGDANLTVIGALAATAAGDTGRAMRTLSPFRQCGPLMELAYAAAAPVDDSAVKSMTQKHIAALNAAAKSLRAPLAETLGLNALEKGHTTIAREFYEVAREARGDERSPALAILENALSTTAQIADATQNASTADASPAPAVISQELKEVAQTPGPLQAKALAILAEDYERRADAAYEGLLDDIAAQGARRDSSLSEARASFAGAKALVNAGRLREGMRVLEAAARSAPGAREASQTLARSFLMNALLADDETRLEAVASFFEYRRFLDDAENGELNIAVARELAAYGANALVDQALTGTPASWRAQSDAVKGLSYLNSGDPQRALDVAARGQPSVELAVVAVRAHERLNDKAGAVAAIKAGLSVNAADPDFTKAAWRAEDWGLAVNAFEQTKKDEQTPGGATRASLAALNANANALPKGAREALADRPDALRALAHMFRQAPNVNIRTIDLLADFSTGVKSETIFMQTGIGAGGD